MSDINDFFGDTGGGVGIDDNADATAITIDSSERVIVGDTASRAVIGNQPDLQLASTDAAASSIAITTFSNDTANSLIVLGKSRGATVGSYTGVQDNDTLGRIFFAGSDGTDLASHGAVISARVDGTPGSNDLPTELVFETTADGAAGATERVRISSAGVLHALNGIQPNSNAITATETLDDYEEGSFTPTYADDGGTASNHNVQVGRYTKVGNRVHFSLSVSLTDKTNLTSTTTRVSGLPFTSANISNLRFAVSISRFEQITYTEADYDGVVGQIDSNEAFIRLAKVGSAINATGLSSSELSTTCLITIGGSYQAA